MLHDTETKTDLLSYEPIARTIAALLTEPPYAPITIGVHGDWGAGKSSILEMVAHAMEQHEDFLTLKFNGWRYQGFEDVRFMQFFVPAEVPVISSDVARCRGTPRGVYPRVSPVKFGSTRGCQG
jgi:hypothetical protein